MFARVMPAVFSAIFICLFCACSGTDDSDFDSSVIPSGDTGGVSASTDISSSGELFNFDVSTNDDFLSEDDDYNAEDEDFMENTSFEETVYIVFSSGGVSYGELPEGVSASVSGADIVIDATTSANVIYSLSGSSSDGMFKIYSDKKCAVNLCGLTLANPDGPALNIQTKKRVFVNLEENTVNTLADGGTYADTGEEDAKGVIFSEGQLVFSGNGKLTVNANCKSGINSDQYLRFRRGNVIDVTASSGNAVRGKDAVTVSGGVLNITVSGEGNKGIKSNGEINIDGGRTTIINTADAYYDTDDAETKGPAGINADGDFNMTAGELLIKATGKGGKGITTDGNMLLAGGTIRVITTGTKYTYGSSSSNHGSMPGAGGGFNGSSSTDNNKSPKGIRAEGTFEITGADIMSRATGGDGSEAIEGKSAMTISAGNIQAYAYDDAINSGSEMTLGGGNVFAVSKSNDGIDSNGNMYIAGGTTVAFGLGEDGVDVIEKGTMSITGGTLFSLGNTCMNTPTSFASSQPYIYKSVSGLQEGTAVKLSDGNSSTLFSYTMPLSISRAYMILSVEQLAKGENYTLSVGSSSQTVTPVAR